MRKASFEILNQYIPAQKTLQAFLVLWQIFFRIVEKRGGLLRALDIESIGRYLELAIGIEPMTCALRVRCSTS
jgi:hypothetical protein